MRVLDIGTANGGAAFVSERRGASRVVAVDIFDSGHFCFATIAECLHSPVEFIQATVYELPRLLAERFDVLFFFWSLISRTTSSFGDKFVVETFARHGHIESAVRALKLVQTSIPNPIRTTVRIGSCQASSAGSIGVDRAGSTRLLQTHVFGNSTALRLRRIALTGCLVWRHITYELFP